MQDWTDLYKELCVTLKDKITDLKWLDLWHNQINFLEAEHAFPTPALFLNFRMGNPTDLGNKVQKAPLQVEAYLFYETFADTYHESWNQDSAMSFLTILSKVHGVLHGSEGTNYSNMRCTGINPVDTGGSGNTYLITFSCELMVYTAQRMSENSGVEDVSLMPGTHTGIITTEPIFHL